MHTPRCHEIGYGGFAPTVLSPRGAPKVIASGSDVDAGISFTREEALVMHAPSGAVLTIYWGASGDSASASIVPVPSDGYWRLIPWTDVARITCTSVGIVYLWSEDLSAMGCKRS